MYFVYIRRRLFLPARSDISVRFIFHCIISPLFICVRIIFIALNPANLAKLILPFLDISSPPKRSVFYAQDVLVSTDSRRFPRRSLLIRRDSLAFCLWTIVRNEFRLLMQCFPFFTSFPLWPGVFAIHSCTFDSNEVREPRFRPLFAPTLLEAGALEQAQMESLSMRK